MDEWTEVKWRGRAACLPSDASPTVQQIANKLHAAHSEGVCVDLRVAVNGRVFAVSSAENVGDEQAAELAFDALECPICMDTFQDARHLPCGHSVCNGCVQALALVGEHAKICPVCRNSFANAGPLRPNFVVNNLKSCSRWKKERDELQAILNQLQTDELPELRARLEEKERSERQMSNDLSEAVAKNLILEDENERQKAANKRLSEENKQMKTTLEELKKLLASLPAQKGVVVPKDTSFSGTSGSANGRSASKSLSFVDTTFQSIASLSSTPGRPAERPKAPAGGKQNVTFPSEKTKKKKKRSLPARAVRYVTRLF
ncbi:RING-type domain-containing protein [Aphelenchoides fujianensis]|nr:RING-type domain-containing protein [Aphelenchoides fujianensis]